MNQPPQREKQTGKRIVSKGEYAGVMSRKAFLYTIGGILSFGDIILISAVSGQIFTQGFRGPKMLLFFIAVSFGFCISQVGKRWFKAARQTEVGIPLTRANTADIPALDSLVRASAEPVQKQESVLLRAATVGQERHEEQLVRAVNGQE